MSQAERDTCSHLLSAMTTPPQTRIPGLYSLGLKSWIAKDESTFCIVDLVQATQLSRDSSVSLEMSLRWFLNLTTMAEDHLIDLKALFFSL